MNHSKRDIERQVEALDRGEDDGGDGIILNLTTDIDDSPHPNLSVNPWPKHSPASLKIAVPNQTPEPWASEPILFVHTCGDVEKYRLDESDGDPSVVAACDLWEPLDEADLRAEAKVRQANNNPIPPLLEDYTE